MGIDWAAYWEVTKGGESDGLFSFERGFEKGDGEAGVEMPADVACKERELV